MIFDLCSLNGCGKFLKVNLQHDFYLFIFFAMLIIFRLNDSAEIISENGKIFHLSFSVIVLVTLEEFPLDRDATMEQNLGSI